MGLGRFDLTSIGKRRTAWLLGLAAALVVLRVFPPERYGFYPRCPFFEATGWLCPGCGGTRAVAALARGDFAGAWRWNALVVGLLPALMVGLWWELRVRREVWVALGVGVGVFGGWRNLG
jgi:hypothetical protein